VVIFITAYAEHAVQAFEIDAVDYLTKPVRAERLREALQKAERRLQTQRNQPPAENPTEHLIIQDRGRTERVPLAEVLYFKAELKYVTVRTAVRSYMLDGSLSDLESRYPNRFAHPPQRPGGTPGRARAGKALRQRRGRRLGRAPARPGRAPVGVTPATDLGARNDCGRALRHPPPLPARLRFCQPRLLAGCWFRSGAAES
jgi:hypothetical protein